MAAAGIGNMISDLAGLGLADQVGIVVELHVFTSTGEIERPVPPTLK